MGVHFLIDFKTRAVAPFFSDENKSYLKTWQSLKFLNNAPILFIFFFKGVGIGLVFNSGYIVLAFNFEKKRNMATGIAVSGCGLGAFILAPLFQLIYHEYGIIE
jgi:MFS family permease